MATLNPAGMYCAYLRKSRRDMELEAAGQGETLARHEKQLSDLAARLGVRVARWYREIVSGETIQERPQVRQMLSDIGGGAWDGVLVMDVDRLARGDSMDQGMILQTLMYAGALVITPDKIYDPADDADAEFFEIKLFFSRREYSAIKKRMQRGRVQSALDGCYQSPDLYGYRKYKLAGRKGYSLRAVPEEAAVVRSVFAWYADGMDGRPVGCDSIARRLNEMGLRTINGNSWYSSAVRNMLNNPTYAGRICWNKRQQQFRIVDGRRVRSRRVSENVIVSDGLHEAIVPPALFDRVASMMAGHAKRPKNTERALINPLAGLVRCSACGHNMQLRPSAHKNGPFLVCVSQDCPTCSAYIFVVEDMVLEFLASWVSDFEAETAAPAPDSDAPARAAAIELRRRELETLEGQSGRLYDLLEQGVYTIDVYKQRRSELDAKLDSARAALSALLQAARPHDLAPIIPQVRTVLDTYRAAPDASAKNALLHTVIDHIDYAKPRRIGHGGNLGDYITLTVYPKYPAYDLDF